MLVNWSNEANLDLNEIVDFICLDNPLAAANLSELLFETAEKLAICLIWVKMVVSMVRVNLLHTPITFWFIKLN